MLATGTLLGGAQVEVALHVPEVEGRRAPQETRHRMIDGAEDLQSARQVLGARNYGGFDVEVGALLLLLEGGEHRQDRRALLGGGGAPLGEGPPVVQALDGEGDWRIGLTAPHEEGVNRVRQTLAVAVILNSGGRGKHALGHHLSSVDPA